MKATARFKWRQRAKGLCVDCQEKPVPGKKRCESCLQKQRERFRRIKRERIREGLCIFCGRPVEAGFKGHARGECIPSRRVRMR